MSSKGNVNEANLYQIESIPNSLSTLASAEMYRRLVQHDIVEENVSLPVLSLFSPKCLIIFSFNFLI